MSDELNIYFKEIKQLFTTNSLKNGKYLTESRIEQLRDIAEKYYGTRDLRTFNKSSNLFDPKEIKKINDNAAVGNYPFYNNDLSAEEYKTRQEGY